jgi:spore maturation protein CgeB
MVRVGYSPSVRLFEAAACGTPIISDVWPGIEGLFRPGSEIALAQSTEDVLAVLAGWSERRRLEVGRRARQRVIAEHTAAHRARELEALLAARPARSDRSNVGIAAQPADALAS